MSLQVWLPLNKNVIENKGLSDVVFTNSNPSGITFVDSGIESCYNYDTTGGYTAKGLCSGYINQSFLDAHINHHSFSLCGWFKTSVTDVWNLPLIHITYGVGLNVGPTTRFVLYNPDRNIACNANTNTSDGKWHHVCGTYDISDNKLRIYLDGILKNTVDYESGITYSIPTNWNIGAFIGRNPNDSTPQCYFNGSLSDIRIYDHALSDKEVYELAKGLMFHLKLDNTDLYDCSGYGWSVSSNNTLVENSNTVRYSKSLYFDGNTAINIGNIMTNSSFTFNCWFYVKEFGKSWATIFGGPSGFELETRLRATTNAYIHPYSWGGGGTDTPNDYSIAYELDKWNMVTMVRTTTGTRFYLNGEFKVAGSAGSVPSGNYFIGAWRTATEQNFKGNVSDVRIYRTALTDEQVAELYKIGGSIDNHGNAHCYEVVEPDPPSRITLQFNNNTGSGWFLEDNMNMHDEYYQFDNEEPIPFTYRPTYADHYISFSGSQIANKDLNIYTNPKELYSYKGIKRRYKGLISVDLSDAKGPMCWYFWDRRTYPDLQTIIFPKTFTKVYVDMDGSFNNITIPAENNVIFQTSSVYDSRMRNVVFENKPYYMRFWGGNITSANAQNFINNFSAYGINLAQGILGVTSTGYNNMAAEQIQSLAAMNIDVRISSSNQFYDVDWDF